MSGLSFTSTGAPLMDASAEPSAAGRADIQISLYVLTAPGFTWVCMASKSERLQSTATVPVATGWVKVPLTVTGWPSTCVMPVSSTLCIVR
nr:hypothetical protein [Corallococcus sp. AB011P]